MQTHAGVRRTPPDAAIVAFAVTALLTAVSISALWSRADDSGDLDWSVYLFGIVATVALLLGALLPWRLVGDPERRATLMSWPGAAAALAVGVMVGVGMDDADNVVYVVGGLIVLISVVGHLVVPRPAFVTSGLLGLLMLWAEGLGDVFDLEDDSNAMSDNGGMILATALLVLTVLVTLLGRRFLPSGDFAGVLMGAFAVAINLVTAALLGVFGFLTMAFSGLGDEEEVAPDDVFTNDYWVMLICGVVLILFWLTLHARGGHEGYRVLGLVLAPLQVPLIAFLVGAEHPSIWIAVALVLGVAALGVALASALGLLRNGPRTPVDPS
ncbi:hypothetical protein [Nocardioides alcanivorans]|uniref:hypothetical protein n=1 Tax=Nocardioides alcanivorans TaxID=2897352 RepID=UPI001F1CAF87|nr:hypothetical protein [Nocardioides alcanivorans]